LESLARIIPWHLKFRFENDDRVNINTNLIDDDIMAFKVFDGKYVVGGVHGHKDKPGKVVENLTLMTKINFDLILSAHFHHFSADEQNETLVVSNGTLMGTDKYALDLRLHSKPSQNIILIDEKSVMADIHRVVLN
jgi:predicted phosphodiesterase